MLYLSIIKQQTNKMENTKTTKHNLKHILNNEKSDIILNKIKINDQVAYYVQLMFGKGSEKRHGYVVAIKECNGYSKILLDTGKEIYRAN